MRPGHSGPIVKPDFLELFKALDRGGVDHVVVGGVAAILEGAPITTLDLDIDKSHRLRLSDLEVRVLDLRWIIASKELADREKDRAMLPVLRRCLEER